MNKCPNCNSDLTAGSNFCEKCGASVTSTTQPNNSSTGHLLVRRKKSFYGFAVAISVTINNIEYTLNNGDELNFDLLPGRYIITYKVWCRRKKEVTIDVVSNGNYYIEFVNDYLWGGFKLSKNSKLN